MGRIAKAWNDARIRNGKKPCGNILIPLWMAEERCPEIIMGAIKSEETEYRRNHPTHDPEPVQITMNIYVNGQPEVLTGDERRAALDKALAILGGVKK